MDTIASYLDGTLPPEARLALERHLNACAACRDELVETRGVMRTFRRRRRLMVALPLAAAAALAVLIPLALTDEPGSGDLFRSGNQVAPDRTLRALGANVTTHDSVRFVWSAPADEATFALTVTDSAGNRVYEVVSRDTTVTVPRDRLGDGKLLLWFVDALFANGQSAKTDIQQLLLH